MRTPLPRPSLRCWSRPACWRCWPGWRGLLALVLLPFWLWATLAPVFARSDIDRLGGQGPWCVGATRRASDRNDPGLAELAAFPSHRTSPCRLPERYRRVSTHAVPPCWATCRTRPRRWRSRPAWAALRWPCWAAALSAQGWFAHEWLPLVVLVSVAAFMPVAEIGQVGRQLADTIASTRRLHVVESEPEPITDGTTAVPATSALRFETVSFAYPGRSALALDSVEFDVRLGSTWRWSVPPRRQIDGRQPDAALLGPATGPHHAGWRGPARSEAGRLRRHIALVAQDTYLFNDTLEANIRLAGRDVSDRGCAPRAGSGRR